MPYPGRNSIYEATIRRMVAEALEKQEQDFESLHGSDTDGQLFAYLHQWAARLDHTPWPREIPGGRLIERRFGAWENAVRQARLPQPTTPDKVSCFAWVQEETERQKVIYREKKAEKKLRAQQRLKEQRGKRSV